MASLDLWDTEIAVLSACETGAGEIRTGEGVFCLRRALVLAGAKRQVMSLWRVADEPTQKLMVAWYGRLIRGVSPMTGLVGTFTTAPLLPGRFIPATGERRGGRHLYWGA